MDRWTGKGQSGLHTSIFGDTGFFCLHLSTPTNSSLRLPTCSPQILSIFTCRVRLGNSGQIRTEHTLGHSSSLAAPSPFQASVPQGAGPRTTRSLEPLPLGQTKIKPSLLLPVFLLGWSLSPCSTGLLPPSAGTPRGTGAPSSKYLPGCPISKASKLLFITVPYSCPRKIL